MQNLLEIMSNLSWWKKNEMRIKRFHFDDFVKEFFLRFNSCTLFSIKLSWYIYSRNSIPYLTELSMLYNLLSLRNRLFNELIKAILYVFIQHVTLNLQNKVLSSKLDFLWTCYSHISLF